MSYTIYYALRFHFTFYSLFSPTNAHMKPVIDIVKFSHYTLNVRISLLSKIHGSLSAYLQQLNYRSIFVRKQIMVIKPQGLHYVKYGI